MEKITAQVDPLIAHVDALVTDQIDPLLTRVNEIAEEAKPAVTDDPTIKLPPIESAIPSDFKLSLDELKFGRNYGDKK